MGGDAGAVALQLDLLYLLAGTALACLGCFVVRRQAENTWSAPLERAAISTARSWPRSLAVGVRIGMTHPCPEGAARICQAQLHRLHPRPATLVANYLGLQSGACLAAALCVLAQGAALGWVALLAAVLTFALRNPRTRALGRTLAGVALVLLAIQVLGLVAPSAAAAYALVPAALADDALLAMAAGALLTLGLSSPVCALIVLTVVTAEGFAAPGTAIGLAGGVAIAGALQVLNAPTFSTEARAAARRYAASVLLSAAAGVVAWQASHLSWAGINVLVAHAGLALGGIAVARLLCLGARMRQWLPAGALPTRRRPAPAADADANVLLADATREVARLAHVVEHRLSGGFRSFLNAGPRSHADPRSHAEASEANRLYLRIKRGLTVVHARGLRPAQVRRWEELVAATVVLEHVSRASSRFLDRLTHLAQRGRNDPGPVALAEICSLHALVMRNLRTAAGLCIERNASLAHSLVFADTEFLLLEAEYRASHLRRLAEGAETNLLASASHLDVLGELRSMNLQICAFGRALLASPAARAAPQCPSKACQNTPEDAANTYTRAHAQFNLPAPNQTLARAHAG